ncbi:hypothetical protein LIER_27929 [Lithospermum erythrorhizon]|uniref:Uncharacterized protein n=1 Tax=Lithospermum erythrorhizon TaxID=34254 RepID=A0AAV3RHG2_LITER
MLSTSFLEQHVKEVVVPDHVEDNYEDDIDGQNMEKSSSDKSERRESGWVKGEEFEDSDGVLGDKIYDSDFDSGDSTFDSDGDCNVLRIYGSLVMRSTGLGLGVYTLVSGVCGCQETRN